MELRDGHIKPYMNIEDGREGTTWGILASRKRGEMGHFELEFTVHTWGLHPSAKQEGKGLGMGQGGWHLTRLAQITALAIVEVLFVTACKTLS